MPVTVGYCTNVHAGATLDETLRNLETYSARVRELACPGALLPIGLWLSASASKALGEADLDLEARLRDLGLTAFTVNGFPYGDFHREVVKHEVYRPNWADSRRAVYTFGLAARVATATSISTLPVGWPSDLDDGDADAAARRLGDWLFLIPILPTDQVTHLDLEPEPGCYLQRSEDVVRFFAEHLLPIGARDDVLNKIRVCHDICHAAVMFEDQKQILANYDAAGIRIGKVQVSSAVRATFDDYDDVTRADAMRRLREFDEPRYLHQTVIRFDDGTIEQFDDLPDALRAHGDKPRGEWRVHFHVPIFAEALGPLGTTQAMIHEALDLFRDREEIEHYEVETYAWDVLPPDARGDDLAEDIARELTWLWERMDYTPEPAS